MEPSFNHLQLVLVNKWEKQYKTGDVIVFRKKERNGTIIKRIVAVPGDVVQIKNGSLFVNGNKVTRKQGHIESAGRAKEEICLSEDMFFVLGDNVNNSIDSRFDEIGEIRANEIIGKIVLRR